MTLKHWILDENENLVEVDLLTWARYIEHPDNRCKDFTQINSQVWVSTIFLGIDFRFPGYPPGPPHRAQDVRQAGAQGRPPEGGQLMLKWTGERVGKPLVGLGLEEKNLEMLRQDKPLVVLGADLGIGFDIMIYYGKDMDALMAMTEPMIKAGHTVIHDAREKKGS